MDDGFYLEVETRVWELSGDFLAEGARGEEMGDDFFFFGCSSLFCLPPCALL